MTEIAQALLSWLADTKTQQEPCGATYRCPDCGDWRDFSFFSVLNARLCPVCDRHSPLVRQEGHQ